MKKLLLVSAIVLGAATASQAGIRFNLALGLPLPPLPVAVISRPAPVWAPAPVVTVPACEPAPVVTTAPVCDPTPVVVAPPVCEQRITVAPPLVFAPRPVVVRHPVYERHYSHDGRRYTSARWDQRRSH